MKTKAKQNPFKENQRPLVTVKEVREPIPEEKLTLIEQFENLRCTYHQLQYVNQLLKENQQLQVENIDNLFTKRLGLLSEKYDQLHLKRQEILSYSTISILENMLRIDKSQLYQLQDNISLFALFLVEINEYLNDLTRQVTIEEGIIIDVERLTEQMAKVKALTIQVQTEHAPFFAQYQEVKKNIEESLENIEEILQTIKEINE